ncbi:sensor histidine kinase [Xanthobacter sediminis]
MNAPPRLRDLLDPHGGDDVMHPDRRLRLNLRRVELASIALIFDAAVEGVFAHFRHSTGIAVLALVAMGVGLACALIARHGQRRPPDRFVWLPEAFVIVALLLSQAAGYFIALGGRIPTGYALVYLAAAAFFLIPPRPFARIGFATFLIFVGWVSLLDATAFDKAVAIFNTGLAVVAGVFGRRSLHRMQETEQHQRQRIAAQNMALVTANEQLNRANAELNSLMAVAAHDLRSPLFGLRSLLDLAAARADAPPEVLRDLLREASASISAMLALIGRVLEAHESEGRSTRLREPVDLRKVLERARQRHGAIAVAHGLSLAIEAPPRPVTAMADNEALDQILDNLLSNAIRFSPPGTTVHLRAGQDEAASIEVEDAGPGVPPEERAQLFGKFRRGSTRPLNGPRGSGLGLYIVRTLAQAMDAEASYRPAPAGGSIFSLRLPAGPS